MSTPPPVRWRTADLPGTGGILKASPADFFVEELPVYEPSGEGTHIFVTIEKTDLTTPEAIKRMARALGVGDRDVGAAGMKDRRAVTRQRLSFPPPITPEAVLALALPGITILDARRHGHKLRTGHLSGNRFRLVVRELAVPLDEAVERARAILAALAVPPGLPNWYGEQRFGAAGDNAARGLAVIRGERVVPPPRDGREKRLLVSALQSSLFNEVLARRLAEGTFAQVIEGDVLRKVETGGSFVSPDPTVDAPRLASGEVCPTGPMFGPKMMTPAPGSAAARLEDEVLAAAGLRVDEFGKGGLADGTRRPLAVPLGDARVRATDDGGLEVTFSLPSGAYATVALGEVTKVSA